MSFSHGYEKGKRARREGAEREDNPYRLLVGFERDLQGEAGWDRGWDEMDAKLSELEMIDLAT